jgi:acyl carrier protein
VGEPGEIVLRTPFRTLGYLNAPEEASRRFVPNPFRDDPADLLYRTGDRGRYRHDGCLEFLGRLDLQVKVRGVRVEPEEVEAALARHPAAASSAVVAAPGADGEPRLVAWVAGAAPAGGAEELRRHLRALLPEPMVPAAFRFVAALPLTPNGKVDRRALAAASAAPAEGERPAEEPAGPRPVLPRTPVEEILAGIWEEVLGVEGVGPEDRFFDLGGHSLRATQVLSRLRGALGVDLPLAALFEAATLHDLALAAERALAAGPGEAAPPILPAPRDRRIPLSFAQQRLWFLDRLEPGNA